MLCRTQQTSDSYTKTMKRLDADGNTVLLIIAATPALSTFDRLMNKVAYSTAEADCRIAELLAQCAKITQRGNAFASIAENKAFSPS